MNQFLSPDTASPIALALLRIVTAYLFFIHGTAKLIGVPHIAMFDDLSLMSLEGVAAILEVFGSIAILLGFAVRPVAFVLSGEMAVAYFIAHVPRGSVFLPILNGGESAVLFCFIFLFLAATGGGAFSVDRRIAAYRAADHQSENT